MVRFYVRGKSHMFLQQCFTQTAGISQTFSVIPGSSSLLQYKQYLARRLSSHTLEFLSLVLTTVGVSFESVEHVQIHSLIFSMYFILVVVMVDLEPIPRSLYMRQEYTLTGTPVPNRSPHHTCTPRGNLE